MSDLWSASSKAAWRAALDRYPEVVSSQGVAKLAEVDDWYRDELPGKVIGRKPMHCTSPELIKLTEWKMARGVWRAPNLVLVKSNDASTVEKTSREALALMPDPRKAIAMLATLKGVGPATASALTAAAMPEVYPFFDELVAAQVPKLGAVAWTLGYYVKYADALRIRAAELGGGWTPVMIERALWAHVGGKAGVA